MFGLLLPVPVINLAFVLGRVLALGLATAAALGCSRRCRGRVLLPRGGLCCCGEGALDLFGAVLLIEGGCAGVAKVDRGRLESCSEMFNEQLIRL